MKPKYKYPYKVNFLNRHESQTSLLHNHFYEDLDSITNHLEDFPNWNLITIEKLPEGMEFCTDFECKDENDILYILKPIMDYENKVYTQSFYLKMNEDTINWMTAFYYDKKDNIEPQIVICVLDPKTGLIAKSVFSSPVKNTTFCAESVLETYIYAYADLINTQKSIESHLSKFTAVNDEK